MTEIELTNELNVAKEFVLALHLDIAMVFLRVSLSSFFGLLFQGLKVFLYENLFEH